MADARAIVNPSAVVDGADWRLPVEEREPEPADDEKPPPPPADCDSAECIVPGLTSSDVTSFAPTGGGLSSRPDGWTLVGEPITLSTAASGDETVDGEVLGVAVRVRFTPVAYAWAWGDGATDETDGPSAEHVYSDAGEVTATLRVRHAAAVDVGGDWTELPGTLDGPEQTTTIDVDIAETVLIPGR